MRIPKKILRPLNRLLRREEGSVTIEFIIFFMLFFGMFLSAVESGILMVRHVMLERAVDLTVRELRLHIMANPSYENLKQSVCDGAGIIPDCMNSIRVNLTPVDLSVTPWPIGEGQTMCVNRNEEIEPANNSGTDHELMLVTVCVLFKPFLPTSGLGLRLGEGPNGEYALISTSAFVNEPTS